MRPKQLISFHITQQALHLLRVLGFVGILAQAAPQLHSEDQLQEVSNSRYWHVLLHYKKTFWSSLKSEADTSDFFLSPKGKVDALAELRASIQAFETGTPLIGPLKQHPQCAFPERYRYLKETLGLSIQQIACPEFEEWKSKLEAQSVSLIFASAYLKNPASLFGHTFLKINSARNQKRSELLDYGVNYSALTPDQGDPFLPIKGLLGFYEGRFSLLPYYQKLNEYVDSESRDIWEYEIPLSTLQVSRLLAHLWELGATSFDYYFLHENCSYQILALLEVAEPSWNLQAEFSRVTIPSDTLKALNQVSAFKGQIHYRPSLHTQLKKSISHLSQQQKEMFAFYSQKITQGESIDNVNELSAELLPILLSFQKYKMYQRKSELNTQEKQLQHQLLTQIAQKTANSSSQSTEEEKPFSPEKGHKSSYSSYSIGKDASLYSEIKYRGTYHSMMDSDLGFTPFSEIILIEPTIRIQSPTSLRLEKMQFVSIRSFTPRTLLDQEVSWRLQTQLRRTYEASEHWLAFENQLAGGWSFAYRPQNNIHLIGFIMPQIAYLIHPTWRAYSRLGVGLSFGGYAQIFEVLKLGIEITPQHYPILGNAKLPQTYWSEVFELSYFPSTNTRFFMESNLIQNHSLSKVLYGSHKLGLGLYF